MRLVLQRVTRAAVDIEGSRHAEIGRGLMILVGVARGDTAAVAETLAAKIAGLRCFGDAAGRMNLSGPEVNADYLVVSQFTLCADLTRGKRPGFETAMPPAEAEPIYEGFAAALARLSGRPVRTGVFGADMQLELVNDGPVTFVLEAG